MDFLRNLLNSLKTEMPDKTSKYTDEVGDKVGVIRFKIWDDLWGQKARTIQTVLAIAIGAVAVGASLGASRMIADGLRQAWLNSSPSMISLEVDPPVDQVGQHEVDEAVAPAERDGGFRPVGRQRHQPLPLPTSENDAQHAFATTTHA
jgi:hypothetical protein